LGRSCRSMSRPRQHRQLHLRAVRERVTLKRSKLGPFCRCEEGNHPTSAPGLTRNDRPHVFREALAVIVAELERMPADSKKSETDKEKLAARRGIELIDSDNWKQKRYDCLLSAVLDTTSP
jgi:hypothetical protein